MSEKVLVTYNFRNREVRQRVLAAWRAYKSGFPYGRLPGDDMYDAAKQLSQKEFEELYPTPVRQDENRAVRRKRG